MKHLSLIASLLIFICLVACSKDSKNIDDEPIDENQMKNEEEPIELLNLINWTKIADTPAQRFRAHIVHKDKLFSVSDKETYVFDFQTADWTLLGTDSDLPDLWNGGQTINFMRNGKWYMFNRRAFYEFDFDLKDWQVIDSFSQSNFLSTEGFYVEEDNALYIVDQVNNNDKIYKYDLLTNELMVHGSFISENHRGWTFNSSLLIDNSHYYIRPYGHLNDKGILISKFQEDFTNLVSLNIYEFEKEMDDSVAMSFGEYIIVGLGGTSSAEYDYTSKKFYAYNTTNNELTEMPTSFYESCFGADIVEYKNEFYLINGSTIKNQNIEFRNTIEKLEFDFITQ